jgi:Protein of unknown function (DUF4238)
LAEPVSLLPGEQQQHFVSKGYQKNFADDRQRVDVIDRQTGNLVEALRPTKRNWVSSHWSSIRLPDGLLDNRMEEEFAKIEASCLRRVREMSTKNCGPEFRGSVINLFAVHLVRSEALANARRQLFLREIPGINEELALDPKVIGAFVEQYRRRPRTGELIEMVNVASQEHEDSNRWKVQALVDGHNSIATLLDRHFIQIVESAPGLPGFVLADVPIIHADTATNRIGFRGQVAVGDADLVCGPLTRRTVVFFTAKRLPPLMIRTKKKVDEINNFFVHSALQEVACHPSDRLALQRLVRSRVPFRKP